jgi:uncharacterized protein YyaL (SSP411 family)
MATENRLKNSASPYLRSAAHQPVDWHEWGEEAFQEARAEGKPILLDIGAVWCHWCHVIDRESYDNPEIAGMINQLFVPVKVDRDERPEVDARYQSAVSAISPISRRKIPWAGPASSASCSVSQKPSATGARM